MKRNKSIRRRFNREWQKLYDAQVKKYGKEKVEDELIFFGSFDPAKQRGTKESPHRRAVEFFGRFPELLIDDTENEYNELIEILKNTAMDYFRKEIIFPMVDKVINDTLKNGGKFVK